MKNHACIFDLDGVIVDTARYHYLAWKRVANMLGFDFTEHQNEMLKGVSRKDSLDIILNWGGATLTDSDKNQWLETKNNWYLEYVLNMDESAVLPGARAFLETVLEAGYKTALGSASKNAGKILDITNMRQYFQALVDGNLTTRSKPDPQVFTMCADALGVPYQNAVVFEDAEAGIEAALSAGMYAIGIGEAAQLPKAGFVIKNLAEMTLERLTFNY